MAELSPEEIQLRANQVTDEVSIIGNHLGLQLFICPDYITF